MTPSRFISATVAAAVAGLIAITVYLTVERGLTEHLPMLLCLKQLLQWDASNFYGGSALAGGWGMAWRGLWMDLAVSLVWATIFTTLYGALPVVRRYPVLVGLAYGVLVMVVMIYFVVPLGHATRMAMTLPHVINVLVAHTVFFGMPLAMAVDTSLTGAYFRR